MKTIYFVRHGQTPNNLLGLKGKFKSAHSLTTEGFSQAAAAADKLHAENTTSSVVLLSSPLLRAKQTAQIVADKLSAPVSYYEELTEFDPGIYSDWTIEKVLERYRDISPEKLPEFYLEGGESWVDISKRTTSIVNYYAQADHSTLIVVSHASVMQICINTLLGVDPKEWLLKNEIQNGSFIKLGYADNKYSMQATMRGV